MAPVDPGDPIPLLSPEEEIRKLQALALRVIEQLDAWSALARARGVLLMESPHDVPAQRRAAKAARELERLGINPATGRPRPKKPDRSASPKRSKR